MLIYNISLNSMLNQTASTYSSSQQLNDSKEILHLLKNIQENDDITQARIYVPDNLSYSDNGVNICPLSQAESSLCGILSLSKRGFICLSDSRIWKTILTAPQMESRCFVPCTNKTTTIHLPSLSVWMFL